MSNSFSLGKLGRLLKSFNANSSLEIDGNGNPVAVTPFKSDNLTNLIHPSNDAGWRDVYRSGWLPSWFNQQWGGAQWGGLPDGSNGDIATGNIQSETSVGLIASSVTHFVGAGFKVSETATYDVVWVKLYKTLNPVGTLTVRIYSDTAGSPNTAIGSAATISAIRITSKTDGEWYQITGLAAELTAGTQYHLVLSNSDTGGANFVTWCYTGSNKYPSGFENRGTNVPAWTQYTSIGQCFLIPNPNANKFLSSGGQFNARLNFLEGTPINQSKSLVQPMKNFFAGDHFTALIRGNSWAKDKTIADFTHGLDHERLVIRCNATTGYLSATFYPKSATNITPTPVTITTTTDVSGATFSDIGVSGRFMNDGADYLTLFVNGVSVGTLTAQSFLVSNDWRDLGTAWIGGGFPLAPTWTVDTQMSVSPSVDGWTWGGTATEANAMSVSGGKLYQNKNGYGSTDSGYYTRTLSGGQVLSNTTGWTIEYKVKVNSSTNTNAMSSCMLVVQDGSKYCMVQLQEYFLSTFDASSIYLQSQVELKQSEVVITLCGKGSDFYVFVNGKLVQDGTGKLTTASAQSTVWFGDLQITAGENADAVYDYIKIYNGGMLTPQASTGASLSEFAYWSANKSALLPLAYNSGTPISIKQLCGVSKNYVGGGAVFSEVRRGVTSNPTSTTNALIADLELYALGSVISMTNSGSYANSTTANVGSANYCDGVLDLASSQWSNSPVAGGQVTLVGNTPKLQVPLGLHKLEAHMFPNGGTVSNYMTWRNFTVTTKP
jgi:hypothetical protein